MAEKPKRSNAPIYIALGLIAVVGWAVLSGPDNAPDTGPTIGPASPPIVGSSPAPELPSVQPGDKVQTANRVTPAAYNRPECLAALQRSYGSAQLIGPLVGAGTLFLNPPGTRGVVTSSKPFWCLVRFDDGLEGWVAREDLIPSS